MPLTDNSHSPSPPSVHYAYDSNGNMTNIDGLACTWDFKDRLVAAENDKMRAEYTYDCTGQRVTKKVTPKGPSNPSPISPITSYTSASTTKSANTTNP